MSKRIQGILAVLATWALFAFLFFYPLEFLLVFIASNFLLLSVGIYWGIAND